MQRDPLRLWVARNLHLIVFLGTYFVATVAGNLIFASPLADQSLRATGLSPRVLAFTNTFTFGYWALLLCPFILTPVLVIATRRIFKSALGPVARAIPEFTRADYTVVVSACFAFVIYKFWLADVASLFVSGTDATSSVEARFAIRERLGFFSFVPLQALLPFLTIYAFLRWMHSRELFWLGFAALDFLLLSVLLVMINMKWPVILFYIGLVLTIFVYARRRAYLKTAVGAVLTLVAFFVVSTFVFRLAPPPSATTTPRAASSEAQESDTQPSRTEAPRAPTGETEAPPTARGETKKPRTATRETAAKPSSPSNTESQAASGRATPSVVVPPPPATAPVTPGGRTGAFSVLFATSERFVAAAQAADRYALSILVLALNRMAIAYPYYYQVFTEEGAVCGGLLAQARRNPVCRPSELIYTRIFGNDGFEGRGTSPQGVHISGYAVGGWPIAMLALVAGSVLLGLFSALPLDDGPLVGSLVILGALVAYHLSQIPGEGVIIYDHGLLWTSFLILGYWMWRRLVFVFGHARTRVLSRA